MFHGKVAEHMRLKGDPLWGLRPILERLGQADVLFGNLETPITLSRRSVKGAQAIYCSPPGVGAVLASAGFDVVNLAHNHIYDFGPDGVEQTIVELDHAGVAHVGVGSTPSDARRPASLTTRSGFRIAFLGYTTAWTALDPSHAYVAVAPHPKTVEEDVTKLREEHDAVVVSCHTGAQVNPYPSPETREFAKCAIESGASVVLCHHPHVPNGIERIGNGVAAYSLGDFLSPPKIEERRRTFLLQIGLRGDHVTSVDVVPCYITDECQTIEARGPLARQIREHLQKLTETITSGNSDRLHYEHASSRFWTQYVGSWRREFAIGGFGFLFRKIRNLRPYHLKLIASMIPTRVLSRRRRAEGEASHDRVPKEEDRAS